MKKGPFVFLCMVIALSMAVPAWPHFGMVIPSDTMVMQGDNRSITVTLSFSHPFEMVGLEMAKPINFDVRVSEISRDLSGLLEKTQVMGHTAWQVAYPIKRPGVHVFCMEPEPYWEPAEDIFIIHYTKTVVASFGEEEGWDTEIGMKTEIVPLSRPFGLYAGNVFQGVVKRDGKAAPFAKVEVAYYNESRQYTAPTDTMMTLTTKADGNGVFTFGVPVSGWWGFAALSLADFKISHEGEDKDVELGAVIWVYFHEME
jgi:cobalt/nickel transport protein